MRGNRPTGESETNVKGSNASRGSKRRLTPLEEEYLRDAGYKVETVPVDEQDTEPEFHEDSVDSDNRAESGSQVVTRDPDRSLEESDSNGRGSGDKKSSKRSRWWKHPSTWAGIVLLLGTIVVLGIYLMIFRVNSMLGVGVLDFLAEGEFTDEMKMFSDEAGMSWLPDVVAVYAHRNLIIGLIIGICAVVALLLLFWEYKIQRKQEKARVAEAKEAIDSGDPDTGDSDTGDSGSSVSDESTDDTELNQDGGESEESNSEESRV